MPTVRDTSWSRGRSVEAGDALIADAVEEYTEHQGVGRAPHFPGRELPRRERLLAAGNGLLRRHRRPAHRASALPSRFPPKRSRADFALSLFAKYVDAGRKLILVGTRRPIPLREFVGTREGDDFYLDLAAEGAGTFQPIFHIDMFVTLVGETAGGAFRGARRQPDARRRAPRHAQSPFALANVYDGIAEDLAAAGFVVRRNPLVHRPTITASLPARRSYGRIARRRRRSLAPAVAELAAAGADDDDADHRQELAPHHVEQLPRREQRERGKHVYLPTFGHGSKADLAVIDSDMQALWEELGFTVHMLGDFNRFAERQGVVHCIKKYVARGGDAAPS